MTHKGLKKLRPKICPRTVFRQVLKGEQRQKCENINLLRSVYIYSYSSFPAIIRTSSQDPSMLILTRQLSSTTKIVSIFYGITSYLRRIIFSSRKRSNVKMDFEHSTQARSWMFDEESLWECKNEASVVQSVSDARLTKLKARNVACGFMEKAAKKSCSAVKQGTTCIPRCQRASTPAEKMPLRDQDTLIHFHAHQIQRLIGPNAIFPELQRSASVLSTAIMLFRRFYLSNSVIDFHPRNIAAASALLAVKVDCERRLEVRKSKNLFLYWLFGWLAVMLLAIAVEDIPIYS